MQIFKDGFILKWEHNGTTTTTIHSLITGSTSCTGIASSTNTSLQCKYGILVLLLVLRIADIADTGDCEPGSKVLLLLLIKRRFRLTGLGALILTLKF